MRFGSVDNPGKIDFTLPEDHHDTRRVLLKDKHSGTPNLYVGCGKWNSRDLKDLYPKGVNDELEYYATQFNAVELNATFYRNYSEDQIAAWRDKTTDHFKFFPKIPSYISHRKWLSEIEADVQSFLKNISAFDNKLGTIFLQLKEQFAPKYMDRVVNFVESWPPNLPLAIEFRHPDWYGDAPVANDLYQLLEEHNVANVIVDTAGRRDLMHMRLSNNEAFIRYVGANHPTDYSRLDDWVQRLKVWNEQGLKNIHFFVHQNEEQESPRLAAHFIELMNKELGTDLAIPKTLSDSQKDLF